MQIEYPRINKAPRTDADNKTRPNMKLIKEARVWVRTRCSRSLRDGCGIDKGGARTIGRSHAKGCAGWPGNPRVFLLLKIQTRG